MSVRLNRMFIIHGNLYHQVNSYLFADNIEFLNQLPTSFRSKSCDIWAIGMTMLTLLIGEHPWDRLRLDPLTPCILDAMKNDKHLCLIDHVSTLLKKIICSCLFW
jgi:serine/threonine protein kinase